ncbi:Azf1p [Lachancea thermotolerans CBS 6340]|uniref:KLTH0E09724p n=1 Tax=Lachancea thermotolerans (strain ATCC 56472 / CBS 6340 / NRRL Y-8284) TaxID=559295 RepID=C5DI50_LACTC|nr:KLTH0E09724p [Lachancea thermotolerans CBS 6340]CAR23461.1 KLTH0E09724p [Lachancea thermotolerans CBS 6340]
MEKQESETNLQQRSTATMPPPPAPVGGGPGMPPRADSISMYTNFNAPRPSTDASLSSFLNITEGQNQNAGPGPSQSLQQSQQRPLNHLQQSQQQPQSQQAQAQQGSSQAPRPDFGPYSRGYSIISNFWPGSSSAGPNHGPPAPHEAGGQFTTTRRQSEQLEPFMPRFKTPSFSSGRSGSNQMQQPPVPPPSGRGSDLLIPGSKRNSIFFGGTDPSDIDFFNPGKRDSQVMMRPPHILPQRNSSSGILGIPRTGNSLNGTGTGDAGVPPPAGDSDLDAIFNQGLNSRKNSMKFSADDFDFDFKRRDSSLRGTLDNNAYVPSAPLIPNSAKPTGMNDLNAKKNSGRDSPTHKAADEDVEARIHKHLTPMLQGDNNEATLKHEDDGSKKRRKVDEKPSTEKSDSMKNLMNYLEPRDPLLVSDDGRPLLGATKVDQLMLMIQARKKGVTDRIPRSADGSLLLEDAPSIIPPASELVGGVEKPKARGAKQHECPYCHKCFTQSTHLEVHVRSHIGYKPFQCEYCGKRFTQGGNLRTHVRLHTGEKPYECEKCGRRFSRKGNLAAHRLTHENLKPFHCKLDGCNKSFTQLGNMKAHQNRFHLQTLNELTQRLAEMDPNENIAPAEKELLDYFADLYKNSNRGIKGRGKGNTRVAPAVIAPTMKTPQDAPTNQSLTKVRNQDASLVAAKALDPTKPLHPASHSDLTYNMCAPRNDGNAPIPQEPRSDPASTASVPETNEFTFALDQDMKVEPNASFHNNTNGNSDVHFKNVSFHS